MTTTKTAQTDPTSDASRASSVHATRLASRPVDDAGAIVRVQAKRYSDDAIVRDAAHVLRESIAAHGSPMGWVETLRTLRWRGMARCDQARFRASETSKYAGERNLYSDALALAKSKRKIK